MDYPLIAKIHTLLTIVGLLFIVACDNDKLMSRSHPIVSTYAVSGINELGATLNGEILDLGDGVTDHGFLYGSYTINATTALSCDVVSLGPADNAEAFSATAINDLIAGKVYYVRAFATSKTNNITVFGQEVTFISQGSAAPTIKDFNPKQAIAGDTIIIEGSGFSTVPTNNSAAIGHAYAPVTKATFDKISVVVPYSTPLEASDVVVQVSGQKVTASAKFNLVKMTATSFEPGNVAFGDTVWFHGTNLPLVPEMSSATIFLRTGNTAKSTRTLIGSIVSNFAAATSSDLTLVVGSQSVHFNGPITLKGPVITSISPVKGPPGTIVTITGTNFNPDFTLDFVKFNGSTIEVTSATRNTITVKIPANSALVSSPFVVTTLSPLTTTSAGTFTVTKP